MKTAIELITEERQRQLDVEGWTPQHDDKYLAGHLALAAACYALPDRCRDYGSQQVIQLPDLWPWQAEWWKPTPNNRVRELVKAGALIVSEIERIQRLTAPAPVPGEIMNDEQKLFIRGAACAIAIIVQCNGISNADTIEAFKATIGKWNDFLSADPDPHDVDILEPHFKPKDSEQN